MKGFSFQKEDIYLNLSWNSQYMLRPFYINYYRVINILVPDRNEFLFPLPDSIKDCKTAEESRIKTIDVITKSPEFFKTNNTLSLINFRNRIENVQLFVLWRFDIKRKNSYTFLWKYIFADWITHKITWAKGIFSQNEIKDTNCKQKWMLLLHVLCYFFCFFFLLNYYLAFFIYFTDTQNHSFFILFVFRYSYKSFSF